MDNTSKITYDRLCRMPDAAEYAKTIEEFRALADIAETHAEKYASELAALKPENDLRRRTLTIAGRMAKHSAFFAGMTWDAKTVAELVAQRMTMIRRVHVTDGLEDALSELSPDDLGVFAFFAYGTWFLHNAMLDKCEAEIAAAYESGHPERAFEANVIVDAIYSVCRDWLLWYRENGALMFEKWSYDVHPAEKYIKEA